MTAKSKLTPQQRAEALRAIVGDDSMAVVPAAKTLSAHSETTAELVLLLESERRPANRQGILYALSWHGDIGVLSRMAAILSDGAEHPTVRGQAAEGLSYGLLRIPVTSPLFDECVRALLGALHDASSEVRYCAVNALGSTGHPPLLPAIKELFGDSAAPEGWVGTVGDEAERAAECLFEMHRQRMRG